MKEAPTLEGGPQRELGHPPQGELGCQTHLSPVPWGAGKGGVRGSLGPKMGDPSKKGGPDPMGSQTLSGEAWGAIFHSSGGEGVNPSDRERALPKGGLEGAQTGAGKGDLP